MMIILVGALLIFGPDRLPEVAGQIGKFLRDIRKMTGDLTGELERTAGVGDIKKAVQNELAGVKSSVDSATRGVSSSVASATSTVNKSVTSATNAAKGTTTAAKPATVSSASTAAKSTTSTSTTASAAAPKPSASKKDPLADVSFFAEEAPRAASAAASNGNGAKVSTPVVAASSNGVVKAPSSVASPEQADALGRARQRRMSAGYNRRAS
jgi:sec-independent protein translocase protein TatB